MKELLELLEASSEELPDIYCDMDQVLCNFMKGADEAVGSSFIHANKDERWNKINQTKGFWANLEWMPGGKRLWQFISRYDPYILSAYSGRDPNSKNGKLKWLAKNTNVKKGKINLVVRAHNQKFWFVFVILQTFLVLLHQFLLDLVRAKLLTQEHSTLLSRLTKRLM